MSALAGTAIISDPYFYAIAVPVVLLSGISKTGIPGLFGGMAVPLLSLVVPPLQAAALMLPILCCIDLFGLARLPRRLRPAQHADPVDGPRARDRDRPRSSSR